MGEGPGPLVKVVVTSFNRRELLRQALDSVLAQSYQHLHVVIVDDASADGSAELAQGYAARDPGRITVVAKRQNRGVADSVKRGIITGPPADYVAFLNEDDLWLPEKLERQLELFRQRPELKLAFTGASVVDAHGRPSAKGFDEIYGRHERFDFLEAFMAGSAPASSMVVSADVADAVARTLPELRWMWDYYVTIVAAAHGPYAAVERPLVLYRDHDSGLHHNNTQQMRAGTRYRETLLRTHPELVSRLGGEREARRLLARAEINHLVRAVRLRNPRRCCWHAWNVLRQRQLKPVAWMLLNAVVALGQPVLDG